VEFERSARIRTGGAGCGCTGCVSTIASLGMAVGITVAVFVMISASKSGADEAALLAFNACPTITAELGSPIRESTLSMGCGETESSGSHGTAKWTMSIEGPRGSASAWYSATFNGNRPWQVDAANVTLADGRTLDAVPCARAPQGEEPIERPRDREREPEERERDPQDRDRKGGKRR
jgi:hypothetical protein